MLQTELSDSKDNIEQLKEHLLDSEAKLVNSLTDNKQTRDEMTLQQVRQLHEHQWLISLNFYAYRNSTKLLSVSSKLSYMKQLLK